MAYYSALKRAHPRFQPFYQADSRICKSNWRTRLSRTFILLVATIYIFCFYIFFPYIRSLHHGSYPLPHLNGIIASTISLPIDHFNSSDTRTFHNRFWVHDTYYSEGGPVFVYDGGEAGLSNGAIAHMFGNDTYFAPVELSREFNGMVIVWEHRFFGDSMPFATNKTTGHALADFEAYKYLNNEQALEDLVYLAQHIQLPQHKGVDLTSNSTPWIAIGGSYAGDRAAMLRVRNPSIFYASWASSAPVQTQLNNSVYYNSIYQSMPQSCSATVHTAITHADNILVTGTQEEVARLKHILYLTHNATFDFYQDMVKVPRSLQESEISYFEAAAILATVFHTFPFFQMIGYRSLSKFCSVLSTWDPNSAVKITSSSPLSDLTRNSFHSSIDDPYLAPNQALHAFLASTILSAPNPGAPPFLLGSPIDRQSWTWLLCTQFAQLHLSSYPSPTNIISRFFNASSTLSHLCYPHAAYLPPHSPHTEEILKYGGWNMQPSNTMFTNGEIDPWRALGVHASKGLNADAPERGTTERVPACNVAPRGKEVFGRVWEGAVHVSDLSMERGEEGGNVVEGVELFSRALRVWLRCFRGGGG